jgi:ferredoxin-NADP reductase
MNDPEAYMCGPPPMIDAMAELLTGRHGVDEGRIFHDKFTTAADAVVAEDIPGGAVGDVTSMRAGEAG